MTTGVSTGRVGLVLTGVGRAALALSEAGAYLLADSARPTPDTAPPRPARKDLTS